MLSTSFVTLDQRCALTDLFARTRGAASYEFSDQQAQPFIGQIVKIRANRVVRRLNARPVALVSDALAANLGALATAFAQHLQLLDGFTVTDEQSARYASALQLDPPRSRRSLYYLSRETFITEAGQLADFNQQFALIFGEAAGTDRYREQAHALVAVAG
jgi:hypothetical protein